MKTHPFKQYFVNPLPDREHRTAATADRSVLQVAQIETPPLYLLSSYLITK